MQPEEIERPSDEVLPEPPSLLHSVAAESVPRPEPFWGYSDLAIVVGLLFAFSVALVVIVGLLAIPYPHLRVDPTPIALPFQLAFYACLYLAFRLDFKLRHSRSVFASLGWRRPNLNLAWTAAGGVVLAFALSALGALLKTPKINSPFDKLTSTPTSFALFAIVAVVLAPLFEELFFRGFIQPLLSRTAGTMAGILLTALLFGLLHGFEYSWVWQYALFITVAGAVFGWLRARTNSIIPSTIMHGCFNAVSVVALAFGKDI